MKATVYCALLAQDEGKSWIIVVSLTGEATAINMIMAAENCPHCATIKISEIKKSEAQPHKRRIFILTAQGVSLFNAMQAEQYPDRMKAHFEQVLKRDYDAFVNSLPSFNHTYQSWYSSAQAVIKKLLPGRRADFMSLYEQPKGRKEIRQDNYVIEDYLKDITVTAGFDKKVVAGPADAIPVFQQQMNILNTVSERLDSSLFDMERLLQAELLDRELQMARQLAKDKFLRSAGAICGVIIEKHFWQLCLVHQIKPPKKNMLIRDFNEWQMFQIFFKGTFAVIS